MDYKLFEEKIGMSFTDFYNKNKTYVFNCLKKMYNHVEFDVINDSFMNFLRFIKNYDNTKAPLTYLCAIARNVIRANYQKKKNNIYLEDDILDLVNYKEIVDEQYDEGIDDFFNEYLEKLGAMDYEELRLRLLEFSYDDISKILNITVSTVKSRIFTQRKKLGLKRVYITKNPMYAANQYQKHKKYFRDYKKEYYKKHKERLLIYGKEYREKQKRKDEEKE